MSVNKNEPEFEFWPISKYDMKKRLIFEEVKNSWCVHWFIDKILNFKTLYNYCALDCCAGYKQGLFLDKHDAAKTEHESSIKNVSEWQHYCLVKTTMVKIPL